MDGQRKKRKVESDEESEEEKMEKFFDLIRSTKEIRERISGPTLVVRPKESDEKATGWNPTFQPQDFMVPAQLKTLNIHQLPGPSKKKEDENNEEKCLMVDARLKTINTDQGSFLLPGPSKKNEEKQGEKAKEKAGDGLDLDLKL